MAQTIATTSCPAYQAYQILYIGFIIAPFLAGTEGEEAEAVLPTAATLGLDMHAITEQLPADAVKAFVSSFDQLVATLGEKRSQILTTAS